MNVANYTKEQIADAEQCDILDVAQMLGFHLKKVGKGWRTEEHESLTFFTDSNKFTWYSHDLKGQNVITLVKEVNGVNFPQAMEFLLKSNVEKAELKKEPVKKEPFRYLFKHNETGENAFNYLVNERGLNPFIVKGLQAKHYINEDKFKHIIFPHVRNGSVVGATIQGSDPEKRYKGIAKNSEGNFGFNFSIGNPDKLFIFEAPIDALSYWSLHPNIQNAMFFAMDGVKPQAVVKAVQYMYAGKNRVPTNVYICTDHDEAGMKLYETFADRSLKLKDKEGKEVHVPFVNNMPRYYEVKRNLAVIYQDEIKKQNSTLDWRYIASIHHLETCFDNYCRIANNENYMNYFGEKNRKSPMTIRELREKISRLVSVFEQTRDEKGRIQLDKVIEHVMPVNSESVYNFGQKVATMYQEYQQKGAQLVTNPLKDWNDVLQYENARINLQKLDSKDFSNYFVRMNKEQYIHLQEQGDKTKAELLDKDKKQLRIMDVNSAEEMQRMVDDYDFTRISKHDLQKYGIENREDAVAFSKVKAPTRMLEDIEVEMDM
jgi:hypothetical protein